MIIKNYFVFFFILIALIGCNGNYNDEESFNELHYLVTQEFLRLIKCGEAKTQDLKAACDWHKTND